MEKQQSCAFTKQLWIHTTTKLIGNVNAFIGSQTTCNRYFIPRWSSEQPKYFWSLTACWDGLRIHH